MTRRSSPPTGTTWCPTPIARGPWGSTISGTYVGGLLGRAIDQAGSDADLQPARLTVDLLRPVALAEPVRVDTTVEREGRRIRLVDAAMRQNGTVVARASALYLRRGEQPADPAWTLPIDMPPAPTEPVDVSGDFTMELWAYSANSEMTAPSMDLSEWRHGGQKFAWVRNVKPLVFERAGDTVRPRRHGRRCDEFANPFQRRRFELHQRRLHAHPEPVAGR